MMITYIRAAINGLELWPFLVASWSALTFVCVCVVCRNETEEVVLAKFGDSWIRFRRKKSTFIFQVAAVSVDDDAIHIKVSIK